MRHDGKVDVVFATPSLNQQVSMEYHRSMMETAWLLWERGYVAAHMQRGGDCFVSKVRNKMVTDFLNQFPGTQNFFFIDDDIGWEPMKVIEFIQRPEDVLCGSYPKKSDETDFPIELAFDEKTGALNERDGLVEAWVVPGGFMRIRPHVLEALGKASGTFKDFDLDDKKVGTFKDYYKIFECGPSPQAEMLFWGEDYTFCQKCRQHGIPIWLDPNIEFSHRGIKKWTDSMAKHMDFLRGRALERKMPTAAE